MIETIELAPGYRIPRIDPRRLAAGRRPRPVDRERAIDEIGAFVEAGLNTVDGADIYTGVEELYGEFNVPPPRAGPGAAAGAHQVRARLRRPRAGRRRVRPPHRRPLAAAPERRAPGPRAVPLVGLPRAGWVEAAQTLAALQREGKIAHLGGTNFDTPHTLAMLDAGVPLVAMQVQYSLLDRRPANALVPQGGARGVQLLCYGTLAGGFFSERWLGPPSPAPS
jgi:diketogulonate reductase-like aldo/keto reductase